MAKFTVDTRFLSHSDISDVDDTILTIKGYDKETVGQGSQAQDKWIISFRELKKGLALNKTNGKILINLFHSDDMDDWIGKQIALYVKDDVEFQGDIVSAIRIRSKLPGVKTAKEPATEDLSTLTFEEVVYRLDHANTFKEIGALMTHGLSLNGTPEQVAQMKEAKESRIAALMAQ